MYGISVLINEKKTKLNTRLFKICFTIHIIYQFMLFVVLYKIDFFDILIDQKYIPIVEGAAYVTVPLLLVGYFYMMVFTSKILAILKIKRFMIIPNMPYFLLIAVFPIGIPLLQNNIIEYLKANNWLEDSDNNDFTSKK
jgi:hypothetical protein